MTESLLERSARYIDGAVYEGPRTVNPIDGSFHEVAEGVGLVCGFSHIWTVDADQGLVVLDTSLPGFASVALEHLRAGGTRRSTPSFTHGPRRTAAERKRPGGTTRWCEDSTDDASINGRQFAPSPGLYTDGLDGGGRLIHEKGETDDHTIAWVPQQGVLWRPASGRNAGNPQKAQRYPAEWAAALRRMIDLRPSLLAPDGLPIAGTERIARVRRHGQRARSDTLAMMNAGARLDEIVHTRVPTELLERPYLRPSYDEPEFVVRNIWRLYGGWHDGNPARLKPAPDSAVAAEVSAMAGGAGALARRAQELCEAGDLRLACQLAEWAAQAAPADAEVHARRAEVYRVRRDRELSLMARGLYLDASRSSEVVSQPLQAPD